MNVHPQNIDALIRVRSMCGMLSLTNICSWQGGVGMGETPLARSFWSRHAWLIIIGAVLLMAIVIRVGNAVMPDDASPPVATQQDVEQASRDQAATAAVRDYLKVNFAQTSWYSLIQSVRVSNGDITVTTDVFVDDEGKRFAQGLCGSLKLLILDQSFSHEIGSFVVWGQSNRIVCHGE